MLLSKQSLGEIRTFLSVNVIPTATAEQAVQYLVRNNADTGKVLSLLQSINETEAAFSFCKENCAALTIRLAECLGESPAPVAFKNMYFSAGALSGRTLRNLRFLACQFQPTSIEQTSFHGVAFSDCEFERLEIDRDRSLSECTFANCDIQSLIVHPDEEHFFNPMVIAGEMRKVGATIPDSTPAAKIETHEPDDRVRMTERFLRSFLRSTHIDEEMIRVRMGKNFAPRFASDVLPILLENGFLEEVPWRGRGVQRRFKLAVAMSDVNMALERCSGDFDQFVEALKSVSSS